MTKFREKYRFGAFYTGSNNADTAFCSKTNRLFCVFGDVVNVIDTKTGQKVSEITLNGDLISAICLSPDSNILVIASKQGLLKHYSTEEGFMLMRTWKSIHRGIVRIMKFDPSSTFLATGGSDGSVKVWDVIRKFCTHNLKDHTGLIQVMQFHPKELCIFVGCDDHKIKEWDLQTSEVSNIYDSHVSTVTSILFLDNETFVSAGRDSVLLYWNRGEGEPTQTVAAYEPIDALVMFKDHIYTGGVRGQLRKWTKEGEEVLAEFGRRKMTPELPDLDGYHTIHTSSDKLLVIDNNHNIHFVRISPNSETLKRKTTLSGNMDEVLSCCWLNIDEKPHFAAATNSPIVQIRQLDNGHSSLLLGHSAAVLAIDCFGDDKTIVSCSRDNSIKLWKINDDGVYENTATAQGHSAAVTGVKFLNKSFSVFSCSEDKTVKLWKIVDDMFVCEWTQFDHEKCVNGVAISPNDKLVASAGADKVCILYRTKDGGKIGSFEGHKKGVWTCAFSPVDKIIATGSADGDIRLWSVKDQTCVKALEGSDCSILDLNWTKDGQGIVSCGSDGVIRVWDLKTAQATDVIEAHDDRCWAISNNMDMSMILSCGADSQIVCWEDVTEELKDEENSKLIEEAKNIQTMNNMIEKKQYGKALTLALRLGKPRAAMNALQSMSKEVQEETIAGLKTVHKLKLLEFCANWNRNSKSAFVAQTTLKIILTSLPLEDLLNDFSIRKQLETLLPFTDRYRRKIDNLRIQSRFANFAISAVKVAPDYIENNMEE